MKNRTQEIKTRLIEVLTSNGWKRDNWGHYKKSLNMRSRKTGEIKSVPCRVKFKNLVARFERQVEIVGKNEWINISHSYYKDLKFTPDGRVQIGTHIIGEPKKVPETAFTSFIKEF